MSAKKKAQPAKKSAAAKDRPASKAASGDITETFKGTESPAHGPPCPECQSTKTRTDLGRNYPRFLNVRSHICVDCGHKFQKKAA